MQPSNANVNENNIVNMIGKVVSEYEFSHEVYGEGFYRFFIEVRRLSESVDTLPVSISERIIDKEILKLNTLVDLEGQLRSYNNYSDKKNKLVLSIFTKDIKIIDEASTKNPNQVYLNGYICKPPIYRTTPFGREIVDLLIAINRSYNKSDYIPCIAWGRNAKFGGRLEVGGNIKVWGRMQSRPYQKKLDDGTTIDRTALEVSISKMELARKDADEDLNIIND